jgi:hypothetical protein
MFRGCADAGGSRRMVLGCSHRMVPGSMGMAHRASTGLSGVLVVCSQKIYMGRVDDRACFRHAEVLQG